MDNVLQIDKQILNSDKIICRHINNLCNSTRGEISQDILSQLRHFVEHILLKIYANGNDIEDTHVSSVGNDGDFLNQTTSLTLYKVSTKDFCLVFIIFCRYLYHIGL